MDALQREECQEFKVRLSWHGLGGLPKITHCTGLLPSISNLGNIRAVLNTRSLTFRLPFPVSVKETNNKETLSRSIDFRHNCEFRTLAVRLATFLSNFGRKRIWILLSRQHISAQGEEVGKEYSIKHRASICIESRVLMSQYYTFLGTPVYSVLQESLEGEDRDEVIVSHKAFPCQHLDALSFTIAAGPSQSLRAF